MPSKTYTWRVVAHDSSGNTSPGPVWTSATGSTPTVFGVVGTSPSARQTGVAQNESISLTLCVPGIECAVELYMPDSGSDAT
jgi:hypothetical protein